MDSGFSSIAFRHLHMRCYANLTIPFFSAKPLEGICAIVATQIFSFFFTTIYYLLDMAMTAKVCISCGLCLLSRIRSMYWLMPEGFGTALSFSNYFCYRNSSISSIRVFLSGGTPPLPEDYHKGVHCIFNNVCVEIFTLGNGNRCIFHVSLEGVSTLLRTKAVHGFPN